MEDSVTHQRLIDAFEEFENETMEVRREAELDRDYYDGKQWTEDEIKTLRARKQPIITINRIKPKIDYLLGMERQMRTDPKAFPRTPKHDEAAQAVTDALRYIADNNDFDQLSSDGFEQLLIEGTEAYEIYVEEKGEKLEVGIATYHWDRIWWDIHSRKRDFSDAKTKGVTIWMYLEDAKERFPAKKEMLEDSFNTHADVDETFEDTPRTMWTDKSGKRKRVRINMACYQVKGVWHYAYYTKEGMLTDSVPHPYKDEHGDPECPLEFQSAYVDRDGFRYGAVRQFRDIQDEINKRRSKSLHLLNARQVTAEKGAVPDIQRAKSELKKPDGWVEYNRGFEFKINQTQDLAQGQLGLLQEAKNEIDAVGANALQGKTETDSGRAFIAKQQSGQMELGPIFDAHRAVKRRVYRQIWNRVRQYWDEERWVRVTDDEDNVKFVGLNQPVTLGEQIQEEFGQIPPEMMNDPRLQQVIGVKNNVADMDVDIIIEEGPDTVNMQQEQFEVVARLAEVYGPQHVPFEEILRLSSLRGKDAFLERTKGNEQQRQAMQQKQEQVEQLQQALAMAELANEQAKAQKTQAEAQKTVASVEDIQAEIMKKLAEIEKLEAETNKTEAETSYIPDSDQINTSI